jgi:hypothetical protein
VELVSFLLLLSYGLTYHSFSIPYKTPDCITLTAFLYNKWFNRSNTQTFLSRPAQLTTSPVGLLTVFCGRDSLRKCRTLNTKVYIIVHVCKLRSSVGIATCYGLDGPGIESRWRRDFQHLS